MGERQSRARGTRLKPNALSRTPPDRRRPRENFSTPPAQKNQGIIGENLAKTVLVKPYLLAT